MFILYILLWGNNQRWRVVFYWVSVGPTAPEERFRDRVCLAIIRQERFQKGGALIVEKPADSTWKRALVHRFIPVFFFFFIPKSFTPPLRLLKHFFFSTRISAECGSRHQRMIERGTSLAGEDRGEGGWNRLDTAVERELLRLSGWKEAGKDKRKEEEDEDSTGMGKNKKKTNKQKTTHLKHKPPQMICQDFVCSWVERWRFPDGTCEKESLCLPPIRPHH